MVAQRRDVGAREHRAVKAGRDVAVDRLHEPEVVVAVAALALHRVRAGAGGDARLDRGEEGAVSFWSSRLASPAACTWPYGSNISLARAGASRAVGRGRRALPWPPGPFWPPAASCSWSHLVLRVPVLSARFEGTCRSAGSSGQWSRTSVSTSGGGAAVLTGERARLAWTPGAPSLPSGGVCKNSRKSTHSGHLRVQPVSTRDTHDGIKRIKIRRIGLTLIRSDSLGTPV